MKMERKNKTKQCVICGKTFTCKRDSAVYCSDECRREAMKGITASWRKKQAQAEEEKKEAKREEKKTLSEKIVAARELGMSYGRYQSMLYQQQRRGK